MSVPSEKTVIQESEHSRARFYSSPRPNRKNSNLLTPTLCLFTHNGDRSTGKMAAQFPAPSFEQRLRQYVFSVRVHADLFSAGLFAGFWKINGNRRSRAIDFNSSEQLVPRFLPERARRKRQRAQSKKRCIKLKNSVW